MPKSCSKSTAKGRMQLPPTQDTAKIRKSDRRRGMRDFGSVVKQLQSETAQFRGEVHTVA